MKKNLTIFSNININSFISDLLNRYELFFIKIEAINYQKQSTEANIIILNKDTDLDLINFNNLNENYLIISSLKNKIKSNLNNKFKIINSPTPISNIRNKVQNFLQNIKIYYHDITIYNEILTNIKNNSFCYLTKVELEILTCLIRDKEVSKNFIKKNILNINSNIETNSLESHLTRIRKKLYKVDTSLKILARNEKLLINY